MLIYKVCSSPILDIPKTEVLYSVEKEDLMYRIGWQIFQTHYDGERKPTGYWSIPLNDAERNYLAPEREGLDVVWALQKLPSYLLHQTSSGRIDCGLLLCESVLNMPAMASNAVKTSAPGDVSHYCFDRVCLHNHSRSTHEYWKWTSLLISNHGSLYKASMIRQSPWSHSSRTCKEILEPLCPFIWHFVRPNHR